MADKKKNKIRASFRKNRAARARSDDWTRQFRSGAESQDDQVLAERVSGKGELTRKRTVIGAAAAGEQAGLGVVLDVGDKHLIRGRVLAVHGLSSIVEDSAGATHACATRRLLKTLHTDQRHVVAAGDFVLFRSVPGGEGIIERVEPRHSVLSRAVRGRQQILVTNVDQLLIVASAAEPYLKPNLIDRFLISAHKAASSPADLHQQGRPGRAGLARAAGGRVQPDGLPGAAAVGRNRLGRRAAAPSHGRTRQRRRRPKRRRQIVAGQRRRSAAAAARQRRQRRNAKGPPHDHHRPAVAAGVRRLRRRHAGHPPVSTVGRHSRPKSPPTSATSGHISTTAASRTARTPTRRDCAVKNAVADGRLDLRRYESYCHLFAGEID